uniref:POP4 domain-containing protein n=1 Tax=Macrostomum lignano TaxID=282301 RepID=A0A1I8F4J4_9PLAT
QPRRLWLSRLRLSRRDRLQKLQKTEYGGQPTELLASGDLVGGLLRPRLVNHCLKLNGYVLSLPFQLLVANACRLYVALVGEDSGLRLIHDASLPRGRSINEYFKQGQEAVRFSTVNAFTKKLKPADL